VRIGTLLVLGLALSGIAVQSARANLVANGNFAMGDFTGWVSPVDPSIVIDSNFAPPADTHDAAFTGGGTLSQIVTTTAGQAYTLSFSLLNEAGFFLDSFTVGFGTFSATITGDTASVYQTESFSVPGSDILGTSTTLSFQGDNPSGQNWNLSDVSIVSPLNAAPEPSAGAIFAGAFLMMVSLRLRKRVNRVQQRVTYRTVSSVSESKGLRIR
jgi:hypothetical protein